MAPPETVGDSLFTDWGRTPRHNPMTLRCSLALLASPVWLVLHDWGATVGITAGAVVGWAVGAVAPYVVSQRSHAAARAARAERVEVRVSGGMLHYGVARLPLASITRVAQWGRSSARSARGATSARPAPR